MILAKKLRPQGSISLRVRALILFGHSNQWDLILFYRATSLQNVPKLTLNIIQFYPFLLISLRDSISRGVHSIRAFKSMRVDFYRVTSMQNAPKLTLDKIICPFFFYFSQGFNTCRVINSRGVDTIWVFKSVGFDFILPCQELTECSKINPRYNFVLSGN